MTSERPDPIDAVAPLADPVRRRLYELVSADGGPVDRDTAAAGAGVTRALAAFHLDRLADAGLLDVEYHRRTGRSGPGAGRTAKFYRRPAGREVSLSLPPRRYALAAEILAEAIERGGDAASATLDAAREHGASIAAAAAAVEGPGADRLLTALASNGFEPSVEADGTVRLRNCPFHALVEQHRDLTCSMNLALLDELGSRLDEEGLRAEAQPREGWCCVAFVPRAGASGAGR